MEQPTIARREALWRDKLTPVSGEIPPDAQQKLAEYEPLIGKGNAQRGRTVFFSPKTACATCHAIGTDGGKAGPDLTKIGAIRSGRDILESILVPSATFAQGYQSVTIATQDGQEVQGIIASESAEGVSLRDTSGTETMVYNGQIRGMRFSPVSLMPSGLEQGMTREEFADLLACLQSLR
jgi:putative heme-binding domain-containing protein